MRTAEHCTATLCVGLVAPDCEATINLHLPIIHEVVASQRLGTLWQSDLIALVSVATAIVAHTIDVEVTAKVEVAQQRTLLLEVDTCLTLREFGSLHITRPNTPIKLRGANIIVLAHYRAFASRVCTSAGADIRTAVLDKLIYARLAVNAHSAGVLGSSATIDIYHSVAGCTIGIEQPAVCILLASAEYLVLKQQVICLTLQV